MASTWPTINTLKISKLFLTAPAKPRHCYEIKKALDLPEESVRCQLRFMASNEWLDCEESSTAATRKLLYTMTTYGMNAALSALNEVQWRGPIVLASS